jgi:hypothetical protein
MGPEQCRPRSVDLPYGEIRMNIWFVDGTAARGSTRNTGHVEETI